MGQYTHIEWCHHTWSLWHGCAKISRGCEFCYAAKNAPRNPGVLGVWGVHGTRVLAADWCWPKLFSWDAKAKAAGERRRVFPSICDPFEEWPGQVADNDGRPLWYHRSSLDITSVRGTDELYPPLGLDYLRDYWHALVALTPNLDHLLLTKRPDVAARYYAAPGLYARVLGHADRIRDRNDIRHDPGVSNPALPNGHLNRWLLASVEDQETAGRVGPLLECPAAVLGLSMEPLLGPVAHLGHCGDCGAHRDFGGRCLCVDKRRLGVIIVGGESGPHARPMHPAWPRMVRDYCLLAGTCFYFKQQGEWSPFSDEDDLASMPGKDRTPVCLVKPDGRVIRPYAHVDGPGQQMVRAGKKAAGRLLDGHEWSQMPEPAGVAP